MIVKLSHFSTTLHVEKNITCYWLFPTGWLGCDTTVSNIPLYCPSPKQEICSSWSISLEKNRRLRTPYELAESHCIESLCMQATLSTQQGRGRASISEYISNLPSCEMNASTGGRAHPPLYGLVATQIQREYLLSNSHSGKGQEEYLFGIACLSCRLGKTFTG